MKVIKWRHVVRSTVIASVLALVGLILLSTTTGWMSWNATNLVASFFTALFGAYAGAKASIDLQREVERSDELQRAAGAANALSFALIQRWEFLKTLDSESLSKWEHNLDRHMRILYMIGPTQPPTLPIAEAGALMSTGGADLLLRIARSDQQFQTIRELIRHRNERFEEMGRRLDEAKYDGVSGISHTDLVGMVGHRIPFQLKTLTDSLYSETRAALEDLSGLMASLREIARNAFPDQKILEYVLQDPTRTQAMSDKSNRASEGIDV